MSLYTRLIGKNPDTEQKIAAYELRALISELERGRIDFQTVVLRLSLDASEQSDLVRFLGHLSASPDKIALDSRVFKYIALGELSMRPERSNAPGRDYTDEVLFWAMLGAEAPLA